MRVQQLLDVDQLIDALIEREGGYANQPADKGGATCFGITEAVARDHGYRGPMRQLRRQEAEAIGANMRLQPQSAAADPGTGGRPPVPGVSSAPGGTAQAAGEGRLPAADERARRDRGALSPADALTATGQAIQLDELIKWVRRQATVDIGGGVAPSESR